MKKCDDCTIAIATNKKGYLKYWVTESNLHLYPHYKMTFFYCPECGTKVDWEKIDEMD